MAKRLAPAKPSRPDQRRGGGGSNEKVVPLPAPRAARLSWRSVVTTVACLLGIGVSTYLTVAHYTATPLAACPENSAINCAKVTSSPESVVFGIPVAVLGLVFFVPMLALCLPAAWRSANRYVAPVRVAAAVVSIGFVTYLVHAELYVIHAICLWCTSVHLLTFVVFVVVVTGWDEARAPYRARLNLG